MKMIVRCHHVFPPYLEQGLRILRRPRLGPVSTHCKFRYFGEPLRQFLHYRDRNGREFPHDAHKRLLWDSQCDKTIFGTDRRRARRVAGRVVKC
jgi:hypothetical protein